MKDDSPSLFLISMLLLLYVFIDGFWSKSVNQRIKALEASVEEHRIQIGILEAKTIGVEPPLIHPDAKDHHAP